MQLTDIPTRYRGLNKRGNLELYVPLLDISAVYAIYEEEQIKLVLLNGLPQSQKVWLKQHKGEGGLNLVGRWRPKIGLTTQTAFLSVEISNLEFQKQLTPWQEVFGKAIHFIWAREVKEFTLVDKR